jgi:hypothetical protein
MRNAGDIEGFARKTQAGARICDGDLCPHLLIAVGPDRRHPERLALFARRLCRLPALTGCHRRGKDSPCR